MADYLTNMVSWTVVVLLAIISGSEATYCYKTNIFDTDTKVYCLYGCCNSYSSDPCCEYTYTYNWYSVYWGVGVTVVSVIAIVVGLSIYFCCCRKRQTAAGTIINGTPTTTIINGQQTTMYSNTGVPTTYMQPGVGYPQTGYYPPAGQQQTYYPPQPTNATAAPPPAYDSLDKSAGVDNAGYKPSAPY